MAENMSQRKRVTMDYVEDGYNVPFGTFTWAQWLQMQAETMQRFSQFQRAIERKEAHEALRIALQMHEMSGAWIKEACALVDEV